MKSLAIALATLGLVACASAPPPTIQGRYAVVSSQPSRLLNAEALTIVRDALRERIAVVEIVPDRASAAGYDGVVVVSSGGHFGPNARRRESRVITPPQSRLVVTDPPQLQPGRVVDVDVPQPQSASGELYAIDQPAASLMYEVFRGGASVGRGTVRIAVGASPNAQPQQWRGEYVAAAKSLALDVAKKLGRS